MYSNSHISFSDDEEEEETEAAAEQEINGENKEGADNVAPEPRENHDDHRKRRQSEKLELEVFGDEALAAMDISEIKADVVALEGPPLFRDRLQHAH